jgi:hypothetical protein
MILHAKVAKLNRYQGDSAFEHVMNEFTASTDEGEDYFELNAQAMSHEMLEDFIEALAYLDYEVENDNGLLYVSIS